MSTFGPRVTNQSSEPCWYSGYISEYRTRTYGNSKSINNSIEFSLTKMKSQELEYLRTTSDCVSFFAVVSIGWCSLIQRTHSNPFLSFTYFCLCNSQSLPVQADEANSNEGDMSMGFFTVSLFYAANSFLPRCAVCGMPRRGFTPCRAGNET